MNESGKAQILVRVYVGGESSLQLIPFLSASHIMGQMLDKTVKQEFHYLSDIRAEKFGGLVA